MKAFNRVNSLGMDYMLQEEEGNKTHICIRGTDKFITVNIPIGDVIMGWYRYMSGDLIQDAFYFLSPSEREFIKTGITSEEWDVMFKDMREN